MNAWTVWSGWQGYKLRNTLGVVAALVIGGAGVGFAAPADENVGSGRISAGEYKARRDAVARQLDDGILLLHARSWFAGYDQVFVHAFQQNPGFYYLTGLESTVGAILVLDGGSQESWLFVPPDLSGMAGQLSKPRVDTGPETEMTLKIDHVVDWGDFVGFVDRRASENKDLVLYTDRAYIETPESTPPGVMGVDDPYRLWREALARRWPELRHESAAEVLTQIRLIKSSAEVEINRDVARVSAAALLAGLQAIGPGKRQREAEAEIVAQCIRSGGEGPSFWPWVMSGPNATEPMEAFADYRHLDRLMKNGELVRVDLGCDVDFYKGDVGRTVPVSGKFDQGQREAWNLLVVAFKGGLSVMRDGVSTAEIGKAASQAVARHRSDVSTELGRKAKQLLLGAVSDQTFGDADHVVWHIHGSGLEPGEGRPLVLRAGMVIEFEPMFELDGQGYYLEDMILITETGHEVLTRGFPYTAAEIEAAMAHQQ